MLADGDKLNVFVGNLRAYQEGTTRGGWLALPASRERIESHLRDVVGIGSTDRWGQPYETPFVMDYEYPDWAVACGLSEYANRNQGGEYIPIESLNLLATVWDQYGDDGLVDAMDTYTDNNSLESIDEMCNLILCADELGFCEYKYTRGSKHEKLGMSAIEERDGDLARALDRSGCNHLFDFERYGEEVMADSNMSLGDNGYINPPPDFRLDERSHQELLELVDLEPKTADGPAR